MQKIFPYLVYLILFLLPWQTRYIFDQKLIGGSPFEYGTLSIYAVELLVIVAFFAGQRLQILKPHQRPIRWMGLILLATLASVPFSVDPDLSFAAWGHLLVGAMLFVVLLDRRLDHRRAMIAFILGLVVPSLFGIMQVYTGFNPASTWLGLAPHNASNLGQAVVEGESERLLRAYGTFNHPNVFGGFLATALIAAMFLVRRRLLYYLSPLLSFALVITFSRSAWLAFLVAVGVGGVLLLYKHRLKAHRALPMLGLVLLTLMVALGVFAEQTFSRFDVTLPLEERSVSERLGQYQFFARLFADDPWTGTGVGTYTLALSNVYPGHLTHQYQPIHNVILLVLAETGILGFLCVILWAGSIDGVNYAAIRRGSVGAICGIALGTVLLAIVFFDHYLWSSWQGLALLAFSMAMTLRLSE